MATGNAFDIATGKMIFTSSVLVFVGVILIVLPIVITIFMLKRRKSDVEQIHSGVRRIVLCFEYREFLVAKFGFQKSSHGKAL